MFTFVVMNYKFNKLKENNQKKEKYVKRKKEKHYTQSE